MKTRNILTTLLVIAFAFPYASSAQTKSTPEYLASAGFSQVNDSTWVMTDKATVIMQGNYVKAFEATQTHNWTMTFGNGAEHGAVVNVKSGDKIKFADGRLTFGNGSAYLPASFDSTPLFKRSILRSAIFNSQRNVLFVTDIKTVNPFTSTLGTFIAANSQSSYKLDAYGNFSDKVAADEAALQSKRNNNYGKVLGAVEDSQNSEYENLCKKYGRKVIDGVRNGKIMVGAPIDLVMKMLGNRNNGTDFSYGSKVISSNSMFETREFSPEVYSPNSVHIHYSVTYSKKTRCVTHFYSFKQIY